MYKKNKVKYDTNTGLIDSQPLFYLPHSCDEWIIGNINNAKILITDLQQLITTIENEPTKQ